MFVYITNFFSSPLEPFVVHPLIVFFCIKSGIDLSFTNLAATLITLLFFSVYFFTSLSSKKDSTFYIIPSRYQLIVEKLYVGLLALVLGNIRGANAQRYFPFIYYVFLYISLLNAIGLIPYTFTVTSHLAITVYLSLSFFIGINIIGFRLHGLKLFSLFLPGGTSFILAFLLVPIEFVSYVFRPISLSIRLFANMMAGHTLLHVMVTFSLSMIMNSMLFSVIPAFITIPLMLLEVAVCFIQAYVYSLLMCIYLNDAINLH